jgi:hypothetical protein
MSPIVRWQDVGIDLSRSRARRLFEHCYAGRLDVIAANPPSNPFHWVANLAHAWGGVVEAVIHEDC